MKNIKQNKKGFTFIEMIVTVALLVVIATISGSAIVNITKARAKSAAEEVAAMMSQSKINAMSGIENEMWLYYNKTKECYTCRLLYTLGESKGTFYKSVEFGNKNLQLYVCNDSEENDVQSAEKIYILRFDNQTGKIKYFKRTGEDYSEFLTTPDDDAVNNKYGYDTSDTTVYPKIQFISSEEYDIDITKETGYVETSYVS